MSSNTPVAITAATFSMNLAKCVAEGFKKLIAEGDRREIGKFLAYPVEHIIIPKWLSDVCSINTSPSPDDNEGQQEKYDRITDNGLRIQVKYRGGKKKGKNARPDLHFERTARTTGRNANAGASNGQVRYPMNSFDVALFAIPTTALCDSDGNIGDWDYMAVPIDELEDPKMPGFCVRAVPASVQDKYKGRGVEVMKKMEIVALKRTAGGPVQVAQSAVQQFNLQ